MIKDYIQTVFMVLGLLLIIAITVFWFGGLNLVIKKTLGIQLADADRKIMEQSKSYNDGMVRDFENLKLQYDGANDGQRAALRATILHRFSVYPEEQLPPHLRSFYIQLRNGQ